MSAPVAVTVPTVDGPMPAHLWVPAGGRGPGLVLLQEIFGVSDYIRDRAGDLAELGYTVLAPEIYWRLDGTVDESREDFMDQAMALVGRLDWDTAVADGVAALRTLRERPETSGPVGVVGFCFGGGLAFSVAAADAPDVLVSYYGSALPNLLGLADQVAAPSIHHFGTDDSYIPLETVLNIREVVGGPEVEFHLHDGAGHAFDNPRPEFHHAEASAAAWQQTTAFLTRRLPVPGGPSAHS
ncbi:dienelactone hydrolase family protein [Georgenia subflava]|uniref:Dienelactone hydrolase family protein n=1 Tax=Georgenia subflava TaxID=1622177 RepID=A0A6N7EHW0_9MICO|nr:dienelactone hydrolase family protein [Georgenia subflava]MPV36568.1 dienelactone hydrolase family protein [Georgenia subflava]